MINNSVRLTLIILALLAGSAVLFSCQQQEDIPVQETEEYRQAVADFYMSLGASQTDQARFAFNKMNDVAQAFPEEAAAWANLGVYAMRQGNFDLAEDRFGQALELKPEHADVLFLASIMESRRGNVHLSIDYLRRAVEADDENLRAHFSLVQELERQDDVANAQEIINLLNKLHELAPQNQVILLELSRVAAKEQDLEVARQNLDKLRELSDNWEPENREQLDVVYTVLDEENFSELTLELSFLRSGLESQTRFQEQLLRVQLPPTDLGFLIPDFLHLPHPQVRVAAPDLDMSLEKQPLELPEASAQWVKGVTLLEELPPFPVAIYNGEIVIDEDVRLEFPGDTESVLPLNAFTEIDYNYNFRNDIAVAGNRGFRLYRQNDDQSFLDITEQIGLSNQVINGSYRGVWAFDVEMDGDLDILLAPENGTPIVLRNNGDDTFTRIEPFSDIENIEQFLWADLYGDGGPEAVFLTREGEVKVFRNLRMSEFSEPIEIAENIVSMSVADLDADGMFDIITIDAEGEVLSHTVDLAINDWQTKELIAGAGMDLSIQDTHLLSADMDNNGALDLVLSTPDNTILWLGDEDRKPVRYETELPGGITAIFDVDGNERLDLLGIDEQLQPFTLKNEGTKNYFARSIRARASGEEGDQRINSFGLGGEMEVRSGLLYQKQLIASPIVHFGLGEYEEAEMLRIIWPNGSVQAEFAELGIGATIFNEQILKGSCPWLFTNDGEEIHFITDILWRSPLGLRINAQETAGVIQTLDRVRIPGDKLNPVDGLYDIRITAELWETHFFDYVSLVAVDHPEGSEIFIDERFVFPEPDLTTQLMTSPEPVLSVRDDQGNDVSSIVSEMDGNYLRAFNKTAYQGLVEEHSIEIELNKNNRGEAPDWLVLSGWLRPTDSSINLALSQGSIEPPKGLQVEIPGENGEWKILHDNYGIPAGKTKTILLDLEDAFSNPEDARVRLTTTSEIYWDGIFQADKLESSTFTETKLEPESMELRFRGYSEWYREDENSPKMADYSQISSTNQRWRDLEGFHTRFGDVSELLEEIDDRYVIMNAGDEMVLTFHELEPPKEGYTRSYVLVSDGWVKDGDYNTEASATVLPLPYHGQADYEYKSTGSLRDDPVFQRHKEDWVNYHTRYITPHSFRSALIFDQ